jgi:hypothetical protein
VNAISGHAWLEKGGLVDTVFYLGAFNVGVPLVAFLDPWELFLKVRRWHASKPENRLFVHTQKEFNQYFGNYYVDIGY